MNTIVIFFLIFRLFKFGMLVECNNLHKIIIHQDCNISESREEPISPTPGIPTDSNEDDVKRISGLKQTLSCEICKKAFSSKANLKKHKITHRQEKPWRCDLCDMAFNQKRDYNNHLTQRHTSQRPNICPVSIMYFQY